MKPYEGSRNSRSIAYHTANAPWPTCSCLHCRRARARADKGDGWEEAVRRMRSRIYGELLRRPDPDDSR